MPDIVLASLPFAPLDAPSLGLSLLQAALPARRSRILYFTLAGAEELCGVELYRWVAAGHPATTSLLGEWIARPALFGDEGPEAVAEYLEQVLRRERDTGSPPGAERERRILAARERFPAFLDECARRVLELEPRVVGLTSIFQQHVASLALARRIKTAAPATAVVLGGANCESVMGRETARLFPFVDAVVSGEGDLVFPEVVERLLAGRSPAGLPGVFPGGGAPAEVPDVAPRTTDLDRLPEPGFADFFDAWNATPALSGETPWLPFETARGCWWGEKSHCTFCGLNGGGMAFRRKSPEVAFDQLTRLLDRHPGVPVQAVDNILDPRYFRTLLPRLATRAAGGRPAELFWEIKANLSREQIAALAAAGVRRVQPGIESLADGVLRRMGKGSDAIHNLRLLKWCAEHGVRPFWNLLWGFPGEDPADYRGVSEMLPALHHLPPPDLALPIRLDRFSPNFERRDEMGFTDVAPCPAYRHVYPFDDDALFRLAYFFTYRHADGRDPAAYTRALRDGVEEWRRRYPASRLVQLDRGDRLLILDHRAAAARPMTEIAGLAREICLAADGGVSVATLARRLAGGDEERIEQAMAPLLDDRLLLRFGDRLLALAVAAAPAAAQAAQASSSERARARSAVSNPSVKPS